MVKLSSEFLEFLAARQTLLSSLGTDGCDKPSLPSLSDLSKQLGVSVSLLREQLEVAKALGFVEVRPRTGIRCLPYAFSPAVSQSLSYAIAIDWNHFITYYDLRNHLEAAYWDESARKLTTDDRDALDQLVRLAWQKLRGQPIQIPHAEHRQLHLMIYCRLGNPFVLGLLEAFWEAYESVGLNLYADYEYLQQVWTYHQQMVEAICQERYQEGFRAFELHRNLLFHRPQPIVKDKDILIKDPNPRKDIPYTN